MIHATGEYKNELEKYKGKQDKKKDVKSGVVATTVNDKNNMRTSTENLTFLNIVDTTPTITPPH